LMRVCVKPGGEEQILITPPTYGMYPVAAQVNDVGVLKCDLETEGKDGVGRFELRVEEVCTDFFSVRPHQRIRR
jgi:histidinol-phosphate aminotransferase